MPTFIFADKDPYTPTEAIVAWALVPEAAGFYVISPHRVATPGPGVPMTPDPAPVTTNVASRPRPANYKTDADFIAASPRVFFHVPNLAPGTYTFDVAAPGGAVLKSNAVTLTAAAPAKASVESRLTALEAAVAALVAAVPQTHQPDPLPIPTPVGNWTRNPGAPVVPGVTCFGDEAEALRYAAQGYTADGVKAALAPITLPVALDLADKLLAASTITAREALVKGTGQLTPVVAAYAVLTGRLNGGSLGGEYYVTLGAASTLASLIAKPGTTGGHPGIG